MSVDLASKLIASIRDTLYEPVDGTAFTCFRRFFLGKFFLLECISLLRAHPPSLERVTEMVVLGIGLAMAEMPRAASLGPFVMFLVKAVAIASSFPYTINHALFDAALLLLLSLGAEGPPPSPHSLRIAQAAMLVVFFQAGVQKLLGGYYLDGQFLTLRVLFDEGTMGRGLRWLLHRLAHAFALSPIPAEAMPRPSFLAGEEVSLPGWSWVLLRVMSWGVVVAELGLPVAALARARRGEAVGALLVLEGLILLLSGEVSFGFTVVGCLLSFFPRAARLTYPVVFVVMGMAAVTM